MSSRNEELLAEVNRKLDLITSLLLISSRKEVQQVRNEIADDSTSKSIIRLAKETRYGDLVSSVALETGVSEKTVKRRISDLRSLGLLTDTRNGREVAISVSSLLDGL